MNNRELNNFVDIKVCDTHFHLSFQHPIKTTIGIFKDIRKYFDYDRIVLLALNESTSKGCDPTNSIKALYCKHCMSPYTYAFGSLFHYHDERDTSDSYLKQAREMWEMGFDGVKMLEGKPGLRKKLGKPLDDPIFDAFYSYLEENSIPLTMHVADPISAWDINKVTEYALKVGWYYGDGTFPTKEQLHSEVDGILTKFPKLRLNLAHFYCMGEQLERADAFLDKWENVSFDLTANSQIYKYASLKPKKWYDFFVKHQNRLLFGTDTYNIPYKYEELEQNVGYRTNLLRTFLEKHEPFEYPNFENKIIPLGLEHSVLENIYNNNCTRFLGAKPREIDCNMAIEECRRLLHAFECGELKVTKESDIPLVLENLKIMIGDSFALS